MRVTTMLGVVAAAGLVAAGPAAAESVQSTKEIASGLDNPRHLAVSPTGDIFVAEAGRGGDPASSGSCFNSAEGPACTGATGAVTRITFKGNTAKQKRVLTGLASFAPETGGNAIGPHGIFATGRSVFVTNGGPTEPTRGTPPVTVMRDPTLVDEEPVSARFGTLLKLGRKNKARKIADLWRFERDENPDEAVGNPAIDSNAVDVLPKGGRLIVADAGSNSILRVKRNGKISVVTTFPNVPTEAFGDTIPMQAVPTGVVNGPDKALYVSQLTGFPFPVGGASVYRVNPRTGARSVYASGFTNVIDLDFGRDGTLYVLEIDTDSLLPPVGPESDGGLWTVPPGGGTPERVTMQPGTLVNPGGIDVDKRGKVFVTNNATSAGTGQVLELTLGD
ncbi:MAG TPA: ScyD/ScyE family protein [Solirubrobacteraceae bacterium]|nr:ScyD/ScyE family protein [Solirubrobacteraceae bacterium]